MGPFPVTCMQSTCVPKWQLLVRALGTDCGGRAGRSSPRDSWSPGTAIKCHDLDRGASVVGCEKTAFSQAARAVEETDWGECQEDLVSVTRVSVSFYLVLSTVGPPRSPNGPDLQEFPRETGASLSLMMLVDFSTWGNVPSCFS